jgi:hypothetical protein
VFRGKQKSLSAHSLRASPSFWPIRSSLWRHTEGSKTVSARRCSSSLSMDSRRRGVANVRSQATTGLVRDGTEVDHIDSLLPESPKCASPWGPAAHPGPGAGGRWPPPRACLFVPGGECHHLGAMRQGSYSPRHSGAGVRRRARRRPRARNGAARERNHASRSIRSTSGLSRFAGKSSSPSLRWRITTIRFSLCESLGPL